jgi:uncharacterized protein (DUF934 family)
MPRQLLRNGLIAVDDWHYLAESPVDPAAPLIVPFDRWLQARELWLARPGRLGVLLAPENDVGRLAPDLPRLELIAAEFSGPGEGRGYSQARILRERWKFAGELRAAGYVRRDQLFFMARCGFNSFELADGEIGSAAAALSTFSAAYQPSNDAGLARDLPIRARPAAEAAPLRTGDRPPAASPVFPRRAPACEADAAPAAR